MAVLWKNIKAALPVTARKKELAHA
jgi:hypothetical protein